MTLSSEDSPRRKTRKADQHRIRTMYVSLLLTVLSILGSSAKKEGDFGIFTACFNKDKSLRLNCYYAFCPTSPSFTCQYKTPSGHEIATRSDDKCHYTLPSEVPQRTNTTYNCTLTRKDRREEKQFTVDYSIRKGKNAIKPCPATTGLLLHRTPAALWPLLAVSLWGLLGPDRLTT